MAGSEEPRVVVTAGEGFRTQGEADGHALVADEPLGVGGATMKTARGGQLRSGMP